MLLGDGMPSGAIHTANGNNLLVLMGGCTTCALNHFRPGYEIPGKFSHVVMVFAAGAPSDASTPVPDRSRYFVLWDAGGKIQKILKSEVYPRLFVLDRNSIVVQSSTEDPVRDGLLRFSNVRTW